MTGHEPDEQDLERALRAPGSPSELAGQDRYLAMFREARDAADTTPAAIVAPLGAGGARRTVRRLGAGSVAAVAIAVGTAGVAAAYTASLPAPVQRVFHSVLSPIGVPPAESQRRVETPQARQDPSPTPPDASAAPSPESSPASSTEPSVSPSALPSETPSPSDGASASTDPTDPALSPTATPTDPTATETAPTPSETPSTSPSTSPSTTPSTSPSTSPSSSPSTSPSSSPSTSPSTSPSGTPSTSPTADPSATTTPEVPTDVSIVSAGAGQKVAAGGTAVVTGQVASQDGSPVAGVTVSLQVRGVNGWRRIGTASTSSDGTISLTTGALQQTTRVRLRAAGVPSSAWRIVVQPTVWASAQSADGATTISVATAGGRAGDRVVLFARQGGALVVQARGVLDGAGGVRFTTASPTRQTRYVVRLPATSTHALAQTTLILAGVPASSPTPTPSESPTASPS